VLLRLRFVRPVALRPAHCEHVAVKTPAHVDRRHDRHRARLHRGAALLDRGFYTGMLADLVRDGLATARLESMRTGKHKIAVARVRITNAGQMALEDAAASE
jgi:hypothetical protein